MKKLFKILICLIVVDFFFFSTSFTFSRGINTKMVEAVLGLATFIFTCIAENDFRFTRPIIKMVLLAAGVSVVSFFAMTVNNTPDNTYLSYVMSMIVWSFAAYFVAYFLGKCYGGMSLELVADYIIAISAIQCVFVLLNDMVPAFNTFTNSLVNNAWMDSVDRLYGIGDMTTLDSGGIRYGIACILCAKMLSKAQGERDKYIPWYIFAFMFITVVGNMVARTTLVGSAIGLALIFLYQFVGTRMSYSRVKSMGWMAAVLTVVIILCTWLYNTNANFHNNLRFGFEGFFSLVEKGKWDVASNNTLMDMYVLPDNPKTWVLGDGYFINTLNDPNYIGTEYADYYMNTDVGYLRFIYYFGLIGLFMFSWFILYAGRACMSKYKEDKWLFAILTLMNFIIWFKVATDMYFILALFYMAAYCRDNYFMPEPNKAE